MMKPPFKASDSAINVLSSPWFDMCTVWFVASLSIIYNYIYYIIQRLWKELQTG